MYKSSPQFSRKLQVNWKKISLIKLYLEIVILLLDGFRQFDLKKKNLRIQSIRITKQWKPNIYTLNNCIKNDCKKKTQSLFMIIFKLIAQMLWFAQVNWGQLEAAFSFIEIEWK